MSYGHPLVAQHAAAHAGLAGQRASHVVSLLLHAAPEGALEPPEWVELVPAGTFFGRDGRGPYILDMDAVLDAFTRGGIDLPIDYDHQTLDADAKAGPVPAAGWIKELAARDGALWGRVEWTPRAAELIRGKEYRFLSPVFRHDKAGRVLALEGAGLTHYPNLDLTPVAHQKGAAHMTEDLFERLVMMLNLPATTTPDELVAELQKAIDQLAALKTEAQSRQIDPAEWVPMSQHKAVADELAKLQAQIAAEKAEAAVTAAMSAGKLAPAMKDWALDYARRDPEGFAAFAAKAPVIVSGNKPDAHSVASNADTLTEEDRIACQLLGMSEAEFAAHKKELARDAG
ncbi:phage protease [Pelomicrobium methylotrophicum]|nr:phage protease [Pelomicrobium methylotrophicum]